jgi:glutathione S-transferase
MTMLTIYGCYRSRASRNLWLANELGMQVKLVPVLQTDRVKDKSAPDAPLHTRSEEFLKLNPNARIPSMTDGDLRLHESLAINLYMAKKQGGPLAPKDLAEDGEMTMWSIWAMTEVEPHSIQVLYNTVGKPPEQRDAALLERSIEALKAPFAVLDEHLARSGYVVGGRFTVADVNLAEVFRYAQPAPQLFAAAPRVKAWIEACQARQGFKDMVAARNQEAA